MGKKEFFSCSGKWNRDFSRLKLESGWWRERNRRKKYTHDHWQINIVWGEKKDVWMLIQLSGWPGLVPWLPVRAADEGRFTCSSRSQKHLCAVSWPALLHPFLPSLLSWLKRGGAIFLHWLNSPLLVFQQQDLVFFRGSFFAVSLGCPILRFRTWRLSQHRRIIGRESQGSSPGQPRS